MKGQLPLNSLSSNQTMNLIFNYGDRFHSIFFKNSLTRIVSFLVLLCAGLSSFAQVSHVSGSVLPSLSRKSDEGKRFIINAPIRNLDEFRKLAKQALRLKPYGT